MTPSHRITLTSGDPPRLDVVSITRTVAEAEALLKDLRIASRLLKHADDPYRWHSLAELLGEA